MKVFELLQEQFVDSSESLFEKLGNLSKLKVGKMINVLRQYNTSSKRHGIHSTANGKSFAFRGQSITDTSEIVDIPNLKNGIVDIRKAYKKYETAKAFALYVGDKAVAFCMFDDYDIGGSSRSGLVAYDFSDFKDKIDKDHEEKTAGMDDWGKRNARKQKISSAKTGKTWDDKPEQYTGEAMTTAELKAFIDSLYILTGVKELGCKLVLLSSESQKKRGERYRNMREQEVYSGLEALANRLKKYKLSKKPTVASIKEFLALAGKNAIKEVQFDGRAFSTEGSTYDTINPADLMKGRAFALRYKAVEPDEHDSLEINYKYDVNTMMIVPFKASWTGKDESGKKISQSAVLHTEQYFKHSFGVKSLDKKEVITKMLTFMKDGKFTQVREMIKAAKQSEMDWPELKTIEKSLDIEEKKKKND